MGRYVIGPQAKQALTDIYRYTYNTYGEAQADRYVGGLFEQFARISDGTSLARSIPPEFGVKGEYLRYERHFIYWRTQPSGDVSILAILHTSQLQTDRLRGAFGTDEE